MKKHEPTNTYCMLCGQRDTRKLADYQIKRSEPDLPGNRQTLCKSCAAGKGDDETDFRPGKGWR